MTDLERRALLGDKQAQEECTMKGVVLPCPTAHKPAHIDREKWGPCDFCCREMTCETCNTALSHCGYCRFTSKGKSEWKNIGTLFCRWCGRPLTEEAWAELERRVLGE